MAEKAITAIYTEGDELYAAMLDAIRAARFQVSLESYIFAADEVGQRFIAALIDAARRGVVVRVLIDAVGSRNLMPHTELYRLEREGVRTRWFHPWSWRHPARYLRRDHRKLLVVDRGRAYMGGFNIHRESSRRITGELRWRDTHICLVGELAKDAAQSFELMWTPALGLYDGEGDYAGTFLLSTHRRLARRALRVLLIEEFDRAHDHILLTTPYFVPDRFIQRGLRQAAARGVDVHVLVPAMSDVRLAQWAARAVYGSLLHDGVHIHEYLPRILHAKTTVIDGLWATVGTANMDYWSLLSNYELNLLSRDTELIMRLETDFRADLAQACNIELGVWLARGLGDRLVELIGWLARSWL